MDELIQSLRRDFNRLAAFRVSNGEWTRADAEEHGLIVRAVIAGKDGALVKQWAAWAAKEVSNYFGPTPVEAPPRAHACTTCRHLTKPGRSDGNCAERLDLPFTYSPGHPLHDLPTDGGASCTEWSPT